MGCLSSKSHESTVKDLGGDDGTQCKNKKKWKNKIWWSKKCRKKQEEGQKEKERGVEVVTVEDHEAEMVEGAQDGVSIKSCILSALQGSTDQDSTQTITHLAERKELDAVPQEVDGTMRTYTWEPHDVNTGMADLMGTLVLDSGSGFCKTGFARDHAPRSVFPTITGHPKDEDLMFGMSSDRYVGPKAQMRRQILSLNYPIKQGVVSDWDDLEKIWQHIFSNELKVATEVHPILVTEAAVSGSHGVETARVNREKMAQVMFEAFSVPALNMSLQPVLSLHASALTTGIVIDSGHNVTQAVPVYEGCPLPSAIHGTDVAGHHLTKYLMQLLKERECGSDSAPDYEAVQALKENMCYVTLDYDQEMKYLPLAPLNKTYRLPDGHVISMGSEMVSCTEPLFKPHILGLTSDGIHDAVNGAAASCDADIQKDLYSNLLLSGGTTMLPGITERILHELTSLVPSTMNFNVLAPSGRKHSAWIGGAALAALSTFREKCISHQEYKEFGPSIVHRRYL